MSTSTEQKLDELKELFSTSMLALKQSHEETRISMGTEITKLKDDLAAAKEQQEDATERAVKLTRRERNLDFNRKGHEEQFLFNQQVRDNIAAASRQLGKLESTGDRKRTVIDRARDELLEGAAALMDRQKMIRLADVAENGWGAVREYKGLYEFADNEEDSVKMVNSDRSAGVKRRRVETTLRSAKRPRGGFRQPTPVWEGYQQPMPPAPTLMPPPQMMPLYPPARPRSMPGPCFQCGEMGHLRAGCPKRQRPYPFSESKYVWHAGSVCSVSTGVSSGDSVLHVCTNGSVCPNSHRKGKGCEILSVNDTCRVMSDSANKAICVKGLTSGVCQMSANNTLGVMGDSANEAISMKDFESQTSVNKHSEVYCNSGHSPSFEASLSDIEGPPTSRPEDPDGPQEPL